MSARAQHAGRSGAVSRLVRSVPEVPHGYVSAHRLARKAALALQRALRSALPFLPCPMHTQTTDGKGGPAEAWLPWRSRCERCERRCRRPTAQRAFRVEGAEQERVHRRHEITSVRRGAEAMTAAVSAFAPHVCSRVASGGGARHRSARVVASDPRQRARHAPRSDAFVQLIVWIYLIRQL